MIRSDSFIAETDILKLDIHPPETDSIGRTRPEDFAFRSPTILHCRVIPMLLLPPRFRPSGRDALAWRLDRGCTAFRAAVNGLKVHPF